MYGERLVRAGNAGRLGRYCVAIPIDGIQEVPQHRVNDARRSTRSLGREALTNVVEAGAV